MDLETILVPVVRLNSFAYPESLKMLIRVSLLPVLPEQCDAPPRVPQCRAFRTAQCYDRIPKLSLWRSMSATCNPARLGMVDGL